MGAVATGTAPQVTKKSVRDAATVLVVFAVLLLGLPSRLIVEPLGAQGTPAGILGILALLWWACSRLVPGLGTATGRQPVRIATFLFALAVVFTYGLARLHSLAGDESRSADRGLLLIASGLGITLLAADGITTRERLDRVLRVLVLATTFCATLGVYTFVTGVDLAAKIRIPGLVPNGDLSFIGERSGFRRVSSTTQHPIEFGVVLSIVLPIALYYAFNDTHRSRFWRWFPVIVIAIGIPMSVSRAGILGIVVGGIVLFFSWSWKRRTTVLGALVVYAIAMRALVPGLLGTIKSFFVNAGSDPSISGRTEDYKVVGEFIKSHLLFGRGFFTFLPSKYVLLDNQYLGLLIEVGVIGLTLFLIMLFTALWCAMVARHRATGTADRELATSLMAAVAIMLVTFFTFDAVGYPTTAGLMFLVIGCCGALWRLSRSADWVSLRPVP